MAGPYHYKSGLDYIGQTCYPAKKCYWYMHKVSNILNAIIKNNIEILEMNEYNFGMAGNETTTNLKKFPLSYILVGRKK